jgi:hypothetical protein
LKLEKTDAQGLRRLAAMKPEKVIPLLKPPYAFE